MKNQCMGCQAKWPVKKCKFGGGLNHEVVGGYPHEVVSCTAGLYQDLPKPPKLFPDEKPWRPGDK